MLGLEEETVLDNLGVGSEGSVGVHVSLVGGQSLTADGEGSGN